MTCTMNWKITSRRCLSESSVRINASENQTPAQTVGTNIQTPPRDTVALELQSRVLSMDSLIF